MLRKTTLVIISLILVLAFSACSYFLPTEKKIIAPELRESEEVVLPLVQIRRGDLISFYDVDATFVPEPTKLLTAELKISGTVRKIYFSIGEDVREGDLVLELDTSKIDDQIKVQEISLEKARLSYEQNLAAYERGTVDRYTLEFSRIALEAAGNHMSDLMENLEKHYVYAPGDGKIVDMKFTEGSNAFGDAFTVGKLEDGIVEILISSSAEPNPAELTMIGLDPGDEVLVLYDGMEYPSKVLRDTSLYYTEVFYDTEYTHINFVTDEVPGGIAFNKKVTVRNIIEQVEDAVVIPVSAVYGVADSPYTYVVEGNEIVKRFIEIGMTDEYFYEVTKGLEEGDSILKIN